MGNLNLPIPPDEPTDPLPAQPTPDSSQPLRILPSGAPRETLRPSPRAMAGSKWGKAIFCTLILAIVWAAIFTINRLPEHAFGPALFTPSRLTHKPGIKKQVNVPQKQISTKKTGKSTQAKTSKKKSATAKSSKRKPWLSN